MAAGKLLLLTHAFQLSSYFIKFNTEKRHFLVFLYLRFSIITLIDLIIDRVIS
jgi:hypothetical protein